MNITKKKRKPKILHDYWFSLSKTKKKQQKKRNKKLISKKTKQKKND